MVKFLIIILLIALSVFARRYYDPETGRWISPDQARQFYSPYEYSGNNPVNRIDLDGLWSPPNTGNVRSNGEFQLVSSTRTAGTHQGTDYLGNLNSNVAAIENGTVVFAGNLKGYGNVIFVNHSNGVQSRYAHLADNSIDVKVGAVVKEGDILGSLGQTGNATGQAASEAHIHLELRIINQDLPKIDPNALSNTNSTPTDPVNYISDTPDIK
jgi:murein DD-endopeptidase MepM/ murein hydrolase activator NlpD